MKQFLLFALLACSSFSLKAQQTFTTVQSGDYNNSATWGGPLVVPPPSSETTICDCKIIVSDGHTLTITPNLTLTDAGFVLKGASTLTFANSRSLILKGNSSIDIQSNLAKISKQTNTNSTITLKGDVIFRSNTTQFPVSAPLGTVQGPASASSVRTSPQFINSTLPVKLSEFKVASSDHKVILSWKTELEINSDHFDIERSSDGKSWNHVGLIHAAGNANVAQNYSFTDIAPLSGDNYYRLKIVDIDAKFEYSPIKAVNINVTNFSVSVTPNPASSVLYIAVTQPSTEDYQLKLINKSGQVLYNRKHGVHSGRIALSISNFPDGAYFAVVTDATGNRLVKNVVIAKGK